MTLPAKFRLGALALAVAFSVTGCNDDDNNASAEQWNFKRIASFPVCMQLDATCNDDTETAAEIVAASADGMQLIYTDSPNDAVGFVDITDPAAPVAGGVVKLDGEPTSVAVKGDYALVAVNTSADYINTGGELLVMDVAGKNIIRSIDLGGQPDSVAISPDGQYAAVVIENQRDEDLGEGIPPQLPAGYLVIVDMAGNVADWTTRTVSMTGLPALFAGDPEPEYVDINSDNIAVVTLQENNHIVLVNLADGTVVNHFSAGTVDLSQVDTIEEDPAQILPQDSLSAVVREPDGVTWLNNELFATANEGDMDGGSRGFSVFNKAGEVIFDSGNELEHQTIRMGHYPDARSENKGNEPENADFGQYDNSDYLFVASERSSVVFVYDAADPEKPLLKQTLPAGSGPEGVLAIPGRNLLVAASEVDSRDDKIRSVVNIYQYAEQASAYPTIISENTANGTPIPWGAMSGLAAGTDNTVYAVEDSFYARNRIFKLDVSATPAKLTQQLRILDSNNVLAALTLPETAGTDTFDADDLSAMINADKTVNLDPEGIAVAADGGFWLVSEGAGTVGDAGRPVNSANLLIKTDAGAVIEEVILLPDAVNAKQLRFGFEGVAEYNGKVYVAFQRAWNGDDNPRIGIYNTATQSWQFVFYPLDTAASQAGGWVGLSDISSLGDGNFLIVERDNQGGPDAAIKRLYKVNLSNVAAGTTITKTLVRDLMDDLKVAGGLVPEKIEGLAVMENGDVLIVNDNDGVDDNSGETQLINLGDIL
ncbi:MAG: esterase-like activity of phytase family protein [Thiolinea sp.]